jgi:hypothetical protein
MENRTKIVAVQLAGGQEMHVEAVAMGGEQDVAIGFLSFADVTDAIEEVSKAIAGALERVAPRKATVEFGLQIAVEAGKLTALLAKGSTQASLKVTLEWGAK